jgi:AmmeMemoRadiSam system protein B
MKPKATTLLIAFAATVLVAAFACAAWRFAHPPLAVVTYANPYDSPQAFEEGIYAADRNVDPPQGYVIRGVIVPHHLAATESIASGVKMLQGQSFKKILLISPDHYHRCPVVLCTVNGSYETAFGDVRADADAVALLSASPLVRVDPALFTGEHGIYAVLPYIAHYFPGVPVTPLVLSQKVPWYGDRQAILALVSRVADADTVVVVSSDFSHYLPLQEAEDFDEKTAETIFSKDLDGIGALHNADQSDCPNCLWTLASLADARGFYNPSVVLHTNSATILKQPDLKSTTSHFSMVWYQDAALSGNDLAVAGDVTLTRTGHVPRLPAPAAAWWAGDGPRFVNLEGPLAASCPPQDKWYLFCNPVPLWSGLKDLATDWGTENNHMLDLGAAGHLATAQIILDAGETPVGNLPVQEGDDLLTAVTAILNPVPEAGSVRIPDMLARVRKALAAPHPGKLSVVLVHGGNEYEALTTDAQEKLWESLIDAGADAVVVSHAHVVGDMRIYKGKPIFRGVGNFIFDQYDRLATMTAKMVRLRLVGGRVEFQTMVAPTASVSR